MDCSPPGSSAHGISQARILEWVAIPFSRGSSHPRDCVSCTGRQILYHCTTWEAKCGQILMSVKWRAPALGLGLGNSKEGVLRQEAARRLDPHKSVGAAQIDGYMCAFQGTKPKEG